MIRKIKIGGIGMLLLLFIFVFLLLNSSAFQSFVVRSLVGPLEKNGAVNIEVGQSGFDLFQGFHLEDFSVHNLNGDPLLLLDELRISPRNSLLALLKNEFHFDRIFLSGLRINYYRPSDGSDSNWGPFLQSLKGNNDDPSGDPPQFSFRKADLYDCSLAYRDDLTGDEMYLQFLGMELSVRSLDFASSSFDIEDILVLHPYIDVRQCLPEATDVAVQDSSSVEKASFTILISDLDILDGEFIHTGVNKDYEDFSREIKDIDLLVDDLSFYSLDSFSLNPKDISFRYIDLIDVDHLGAEWLSSINGRIDVQNMSIRSQKSLVKIDGHLISPDNRLDLDNWEQWDIDLAISGSFISGDDVMTLFPGIKKKEIKIRDKKAFVDAKIKGNSYDVHFTDLQLSVPGLMHFDGDADLYNLAHPDNALINMVIRSSRFDMEKLDNTLRFINLPKEVTRLGKVRLNGFFDGFKNSFVTTASLATDLGLVDLDVQFDIANESQYSGLVNMHSFDLGRLLDNKDFGLVNLTADIKEGTGLNKSDVNASFTSVIDTFQYKGYTYQNAHFEGLMSNSVVDGKFSLSDANIDLNFDGKIDLTNDLPKYNFNIAVERADLCAINLSQFPCEVSFNGDIDMTGKDLNSLEGHVYLDSLYMAKDDRELFMQYANINSSSVPQGMLFEVATNEIDAKVRGRFDLLSAHKVILNLLVDDYPDIAKRLKIKAPYGIKGNEDFDFAIDVKDFAGILSFLNSKQVKDIVGELRGRWNYENGLSTNSFTLKKLDVFDVSLDNLVFNLDSKRGEGGFSLFIDKLVRANQELDGFELNTKVVHDTILFRLYNDIVQKNRIDISGRAIPWDEGYRVVFESPRLQVDSTQWTLDPKAEIRFDREYLIIDNFKLQSGNRTIVLDDIKKQGIYLSLKEFDFSVINPFVNYDKMNFDGTVDVTIKADNILSDRLVRIEAQVPDFTINQDSFGMLKLEALEKNNEIIDLSLSIEKGEQTLDVVGYYDVGNGFINSDIELIKYPMTIFEYIIDDGISNTIGTTNLKAKIYGEVSDLKLKGEGLIENAGTTIDYIGGFYRIEDQKVTLDETFIDLNNTELIDELGNVAVITGGLTHDFLGDFKANLSISSENFIGLKTTKADNDLYYGTGIGDITVSFLGPFDAIDIRVDAVAGEGSSLNIPIESTEYGLDKGFIVFDYQEAEDTTSRAEEILKALQGSGVDFEMKLSFTPQADIYVIFDQSVNEVLYANGTGDIQLYAKRDGTFEAFGDYEVESGQYLYSAYGFIAKPFIINRGGVVRWSGDPYNAALLDVNADYTLRAPLDVLLSEFLISATESVQAEAQNRTNVNLSMLLTGTLFNPTVNFDINFPDVAGELKTYTDNKMRSLRATENGINNQVVGLLVFNNFLPNNNPLANISGNILGQAGNNTITEFLSSQISVLFSEYISGKLKDDSFINDIDFDIALSQNTSFLQDQSSDFVGGLVDFVPDQVGVNVRPTFKNSDIVLNVGTNYVRQSALINETYLTGDFSLDWYITNDKKLKLRFYGDFDYDEAFSTRRQKYGFGINYRREFGKLSNITQTLDKIVEEINRLPSQ